MQKIKYVDNFYCKRQILSFHFQEYFLKNETLETGMSVFQKQLPLLIDNQYVFEKIHLYSKPLLFKIFFDKLYCYECTAEFDEIESGLSNAIVVNDIALLIVNDLYSIQFFLNKYYDEVTSGKLLSNYDTAVFGSPIQWHSDLNNKHILLIHHDFESLFLLSPI